MNVSQTETYIRKLLESATAHKREKMELAVINLKERSLTIKVGADKSRGVPYQKVNQLQGGYAAVFTDSPMWIVLMFDKSLRNKVIRTSKIETHWFKPARANEGLVVHARYRRQETKNGKTRFFSSAIIKNRKGETVAVVKAVNQLIEK